jgi:hypothetical protein
LALEELAKVLEKNGGNEDKLAEIRKNVASVAEKIPYWAERSIYLHVPTWTV